MSKQCEIIQDLLPLYVDGACSNSNEELVKEHLENCTACNELYQKMCSDTSEKMLKSKKYNIITHHKRTKKQKIIKYIFFAIAILYIPTLFIIPAFAEDNGAFLESYSFIVLVLAIYTLPFYFAFIELGLAVCRVLEKKRTTTLEKVLNIIGVVFALSTVLITVIAYAFELSEMVLLLLAVTFLLALKWIVTAIICKKKPDFSILKQKKFWFCAVILAAVITAIIILTSDFLVAKNQRGDFTKVEYNFVYCDSGTEYEGLYFDIDAH